LLEVTLEQVSAGGDRIGKIWDDIKQQRTLKALHGQVSASALAQLELENLQQPDAASLVFVCVGIQHSRRLGGSFASFLQRQRGTLAEK